ncbi:MAG TPA: cobyric acid synthase [Steroidobacteraceae bacterium]|nr:cobyric acid synthase [Steroidobacteraceae bacterium]
MAALMIQGCGSDVGKSLLVAGLCRLLTNRGKVVRPFKPQNMSNNAAVTASGGEIGRSTALQALACRTPPTVDMNPVLLKPQSDSTAQLIVRGRRIATRSADAFSRDRSDLLQIALDSFRGLQREAEFVIVEGAGSPAETNLRAHDIANMGFAHAANVPVALVGDIDRGHVIASLVGAHAVLDARDRERVRGFIINKFRGDVGLFRAGLDTIETRTGWQSFGVVPWLHSAGALPAEDAMQLEQGGPDRPGARVRIAIPHLPHIANFDDFDPLRFEPEVQLEFVAPGRPLPLDADLIILPGSKATIADLEFLRAQGWHIDLQAHVRRGGRVLGICAGYQMLGRSVEDPQRIEGPQTSCAGLDLLGVHSTMTEAKTLRPVCGIDLTTGARIAGYEMHLGATGGGGASRPMIRFDDGAFDGAVSADGRILGCHVHGLFADPAFRTAYLATLGARSSGEDHAQRVDRALDEIGAALESALAIDRLLT